MAPVLYRHVPFYFDIHQGQINRLLSSHIVRELHLGLGILPDSAVYIFNGVSGVNDFAGIRPGSQNSWLADPS